MSTWLPIASGILAVFFWGVSFVAIKIALPQMTLETMIFFRQFLGTLTVAIIVGLRGEWQLRMLVQLSGRRLRYQQRLQRPSVEKPDDRAFDGDAEQTGDDEGRGNSDDNGNNDQYNDHAEKIETTTLKPCNTVQKLLSLINIFSFKLIIHHQVKK